MVAVQVPDLFWPVGIDAKDYIVAYRTCDGPEGFARIVLVLKEAKENNGAGNMIRHKIKNGENLGGIAIKYGVSVKQIMKWNNLKNSNIRAGRYLKIYK